MSPRVWSDLKVPIAPAASARWTAADGTRDRWDPERGSSPLSPSLRAVSPVKEGREGGPFIELRNLGKREPVSRSEGSV
ncbi:hypothetical protein EVAR_84982_1 [Eumeta japonica]|uniref:Uncharacterized protein n=1 Tax=Eumeta variegata TaxID=151549 RepID=A0A4C1W928_EUMVA|nr:hypothetical protein EVAR_84982_1 [Eumeta japonica]